MKKVLKIVFGFIGFIYLVVAIFAIVCLLKKNDFGYPQFGNKTLFVVEEDSKDTGYQEGDLIVLYKPNNDDVKINENNLFKKISYIKGNACFAYGDATSLGILKGIGGTADFDDSKVVDLGDLQYIDGYAIYDNSKLKPEDFDRIKIGKN